MLMIKEVERLICLSQMSDGLLLLSLTACKTRNQLLWQHVRKTQFCTRMLLDLKIDVKLVEQQSV